MTCVLISVCLLIGCGPSPDQVKEILVKHPEILFAAIEANPDEFFEVVGRAQSKARETSMDEQMDGELKRVLKEIADSKDTPAFDESRPTLGQASAKITIFEWVDFKCGYCAKSHEMLAELVPKYADTIRIQYRHLPILSPESKRAAEVMEAIALQDKDLALKFSDALFANQAQFREGGEGYLKKITEELGADWTAVLRDSKSDAIKKRIADDIEIAQKNEFSGTPGFMVNGGRINGAYPLEFFSKLIDELLKAG